MSEEVQQVNQIIQERLNKLAELKTSGWNYPNHLAPSAYSEDLHLKFDALNKLELEAKNIKVSIAGRIMLKRVMGKASFCTIQDAKGKIQIYVMRDNFVAGFYNEQFKTFDLGDIIYVEGELFKTNTNELSINAVKIDLLNKAINPLPDKFSGLNDTEIRYRQRYLDLIVNTDVAQKFKLRSKIIQHIRNYFLAENYLEVETPMLHMILGGANAKPFVTHHNALDMDLFLRIAPELHLKRLIVGGFDRVFEINRCFRNEGLSAKHNPEFTTIEFYQAYANYKDMIAHTETLFSSLIDIVAKKDKVLEYKGNRIDFTTPFRSLDMLDAILEYSNDIKEEELHNIEALQNILIRYKIKKDKHINSLGGLQTLVFEELVEDKLINPTFITGHPKEVSPLARADDENPHRAQRFELYIGGYEVANGFSELNDPLEQDLRFKEQVAEKSAGNDEAMYYDADYVEALKYAMAPTAGEGIGIDRLVMILTNSPSIKDVILFPTLKKEN